MTAPLNSAISACRMCDLRAKCKQVVISTGSPTSRIMVVGGAPGYFEDKAGEQFSGRSGQEFDRLLQRFTPLSLNSLYVTSAIKCRPAGDRIPKPEQLATCRAWLLAEIQAVSPDFIITHGALAARTILGDKFDTMNMQHGVLHSDVSLPDLPSVTFDVLPCFHPASGIHEPRIMIQAHSDLEVLGEVARGKYKRAKDPWEGIEQYRWIESFSDPKFGMFREDMLGSLIAVDTETKEEGNPWTAQFSSVPSRAWCVPFEAKDVMKFVLDMTAKATFVMHYAQFDLKIFDQAGFPLSQKIIDTMQMAYVLQDQPKGLKALAYRLRGMEMESYGETIHGPQHELSDEYLIKVKEGEWPSSPDERVWCNKLMDYKWKKRQHIQTLVKRAYTDHDKNPAVDFLARWDGWPVETKAPVIKALGPMPEANLTHIDRDVATYYACRDADATLRVSIVLMSLIKKAGLENVLDMDHAVIPIITDMAKTGMLLDTERVLELGRKAGERLDELKTIIWDMVGHKFLISSSQQLSKVLFQELGLPALKISRKTGDASTDSSVIDRLFGKHPIIPFLKEFKDLDKQKSGFLDPLPKLVDKDSRLHPNIKLTRTITGRFAFGEPNLQQVPKRKETAKALRRAFLPSPGGWLCEADYSGVEMRVMAALSKDPNMMEIFLTGKDLHVQTAMWVFGVDEDAVMNNKALYRVPAKTIGFGVAYGMSAGKLQERLECQGCKGWTLDRCKEAIVQWFDVFKEVDRMRRMAHAEARRWGYVRDYWGRIRRIPEVKCLASWIVEAGLREAFNMKIQGSAGGIIKIAMAKLWVLTQEIRAKGTQFDPIVQVHDSKVFQFGDVRKAEASALALKVRRCMINAVKLDVPLDVDVEIGRNWAEMEEVK